MAEEDEMPRPVWNDVANENPGPFNEDGKPHGEGTMTYPPPPQREDDDEERPPDTFVGTLDGGVRSGQGKYTWSNGCYYEGGYAGGEKHGAGVQTFPDGSKYEGDFVHNVPEGRGVWTFANGDVYSGKISAGKEHGEGCYHCAKAQCQYVGTFAEGSFTEGRWVLKDGSCVRGMFGPGPTPTGDAVYTFARPGLKQEGRFEAGMRWVGGAISAA